MRMGMAWEFSFLDFDEAGGDFEPGEDDVEVVEGVGGLGVGDGVRPSGMRMVLS